MRHHRQLPWLWRWRRVDVDKLATLREPLVLAGDFNDFPPGPVTRTLANRLVDAGARIAGARDLALAAAAVAARSRLHLARRRGGAREVARSPLLRVASDHLPIVVDAEVDAQALPLGARGRVASASSVRAHANGAPIDHGFQRVASSRAHAD